MTNGRTNLAMGLLELPREIRDEILSYVLQRSLIMVTMPRTPPFFWAECCATQPELCFATKQLRTESLSIFYSTNDFLIDPHFDSALLTANNWLAAIGQHNLQHLQHLVLRQLVCVSREQKMSGYRDVRVVFNLWLGTARFAEEWVVEWESRGLVFGLEAWMHRFRQNFEFRSGMPFTAEDLRELVREFRDICAEHEVPHIPDPRPPRALVEAAEAAMQRRAG